MIINNMKYNNFLFVIPLLFITCLINAQSEKPWGLSAKYIYLDFDSDFSDDLFKSNSAGVEVAYHKSINDFISLAFPLRMGKSTYERPDGTEEEHALLGLDGQIHLKYDKGQFLVPYLLAGLGGFYEFENSEFILEAPLGIGLNFKLGPDAFLNTEASYRLAFSDDDQFKHLQFSAGVLFLINDNQNTKPPISPATNDKDGDGVADENDVCPNVPGFKKYNGCPDTDGDGVSDDKDKCPGTKGLLAFEGCPDTDKDGIVDFEDDCPTVAGPKERNGCPPGDSDGDSVNDDDDDCPNTYGLPRYKGCPDSDGDGVIDSQDECPDKVGLARFNGCPDTDGDGIIDSKDRCPAKAGSAANNGCPEIAAEDRAILTRAISDVRFETGKDELKPTSFPVLNQIADLMSKYPGYNLIISGHTDSVGEAAANQRLSEDRARACFSYLVNRGVQGYRMKSIGYGETQPIDSNNTAAGKARNRRVTFEMKMN